MCTLRCNRWLRAVLAKQSGYLVHPLADSRVARLSHIIKKGLRNRLGAHVDQSVCHQFATEPQHHLVPQPSSNWPANLQAAEYPKPLPVYGAEVIGRAP